MNETKGDDYIGTRNGPENAAMEPLHLQVSQPTDAQNARVVKDFIPTAPTPVPSTVDKATSERQAADRPAQEDGIEWVTTGDGTALTAVTADDGKVRVEVTTGQLALYDVVKPVGMRI